jgi:hypothetical protein
MRTDDDTFFPCGTRRAAELDHKRQTQVADIIATTTANVEAAKKREADIWVEIHAIIAAQEARAEAEHALREQEDARERDLRDEVDRLHGRDHDEGMW